jgi:hypothetical protein
MEGEQALVSHIFNYIITNTWKVSIPANTNFIQNVSNLDLSNKDLLMAMDELSEVFQDPPAQKHVHIVVQPLPTGELQSLWPAVPSLIVLTCYRAPRFCACTCLLHSRPQA